MLLPTLRFEKVLGVKTGSFANKDETFTVIALEASDLSDVPTPFVALTFAVYVAA